MHTNSVLGNSENAGAPVAQAEEEKARENDTGRPPHKTKKDLRENPQILLWSWLPGTDSNHQPSG